MTRYWVIASYKSTKARIIEKAGQYYLENDTIALRWKEMGDISRIDTKSDLEAKYREPYSDEITKGSVKRGLNAFLDNLRPCFTEDMCEQIGDQIFLHVFEKQHSAQESACTKAA